MENIIQEMIDGVIKYSRICPNCGKILYYTIKGNAVQAYRKKKICNKCNGLKNGKRNAGEGNPFYGKKHSNETIEKINKSRKENNYASFKTPEFLEKMRKISTENNPMKGRSVYSVWLEKYGKEEADKRMNQMKEKHRKNMSGAKNHQFGKPPPRGTGNGWKGWYKDIYFRSLRELMILIQLIDNNTPYISLEGKEYGVKYVDYAGVNRTYFGDYLINNEWIEIKPIRLQNSVQNTAKQKAAEEVCKQRGWTFKYIDPIINSELIKIKYLSGDIKFDVRYKDKIDKYYGLGIYSTPESTSSNL